MSHGPISHVVPRPSVALVVLCCGPTGIIVERRKDSKSGTVPWEKVTQLAATASTYTDASYRAGQSVSYRVRAVNNEGTSAYSNIVRLTATHQ